jgi:hypothetical protein
MAHYTLLDENNIVIEVFVGKDENEDGVNWEEWYGNFRGQKCKRTSYNTREGIHIDGGTPFRKNYAGIGFFYDEERDAFYMLSPFPSWVFNEEKCIYQAPTEKPVGLYDWDEDSLSWKEIIV